MNLKPVLFMSLLGAQICFGSHLPTRFESNLEPRGGAVPRALSADEIDPGILDALKSKSGTPAHFYLSEEVIKELLPTIERFVAHAYANLPPGHRGTCTANAYYYFQLSNRRRSHILALVEPLTGPESFDFPFDEVYLYPHYERFFSARNEDGSFRLAHLGLHIGTLKMLVEADLALKFLVQNTSLTSLRLYGGCKEENWDALKHFPHLTHLDLSHITCDEQSAKNLISYLQGDHHLVSFQRPQMDAVTAIAGQILATLSYIVPPPPPSPSSFDTLAQVERNFETKGKRLLEMLLPDDVTRLP